MCIELPDAGKVLVLSDLHIGDPRFCDCSLHVIWRQVQKESPCVLVLGGDVLEGWLSTVEQRAKLKSVCSLVGRVVVLSGNHDTEGTKLFAMSVGAWFGGSVVGVSAASTFAIEHGNRFDSLWHRIPGLGRMSIWFNRVLYRMFGWDVQAWLRKFKFVEKRLLQQHVKAKAAWPGKDIVVTGHTHLPTNDPFGVGYFNSGDWLYHRSYVVIENGAATLKCVQE